MFIEPSDSFFRKRVQLNISFHIWILIFHIFATFVP